jgi:hypothetical protein
MTTGTTNSIETKEIIEIILMNSDGLQEGAEFYEPHLYCN